VERPTDETHGVESKQVPNITVQLCLDDISLLALCANTHRVLPTRGVQWSSESFVFIEDSL
jgi:hypothetical protein